MNGYGLGVPSELLEALADRVAILVAERLPNRPEPFLDVEAAAEYLSCPKSRIYELASPGRDATPRVRHYRDGRRLLFRRSDLDAALTARGPE